MAVWCLVQTDRRRLSLFCMLLMAPVFYSATRIPHICAHLGANWGLVDASQVPTSGLCVCVRVCVCVVSLAGELFIWREERVFC